MTGLGYAGKDSLNINRWNRTQNVDMRKIEFAANPRMLLASWNINTAEWLRHSVYNRIHPEGSKGSTTLATYVTFIVSAFWHGFFPGYYFTFIGLSIITVVNRILRRHVRPIFLSRLARFKVLYDIMGWVCTHLIFAYIMPAFFLRSFRNAFYAYRVNYFSGHIVMILIWAWVTYLGGSRILKQLSTEREKTE
jgi:lysophospholipid acyltransferase